MAAFNGYGYGSSRMRLGARVRRVSVAAPRVEAQVKAPAPVAAPAVPAPRKAPGVLARARGHPLRASWRL